MDILPLSKNENDKKVPDKKGENIEEKLLKNVGFEFILKKEIEKSVDLIKENINSYKFKDFDNKMRYALNVMLRTLEYVHNEGYTGKKISNNIISNNKVIYFYIKQNMKLLENDRKKKLKEMIIERDAENEKAKKNS